MKSSELEWSSWGLVDGRPPAGGGTAARARAFTAAISLVVAIIAAVVVPAFASAKSVDRFVGGTGNGAGQLFNARGVAVNDSTGDIYVADGGNHRVSRYNADGVFELTWGRDVRNPAGGTTTEVCTAADGNTSAGGVGCKAGIAGTAIGEFSTPVGLTIDQADGSVYVVDQNNRRVQKFTAAGDFILMFGDAVNQTTGGDVCTAASGDVCKAGVTGAGSAQLGNANPLASRMNVSLHPTTGEVFIADAGNRRILQYASSGTFLRAWGYDVDTAGIAEFEVCSATCRAGQTTNGGANAGQWATNQPQNIAVDADGVVYASDAGLGNRIIRFDSDGFAAPPAALLPDILASNQAPPGVLMVAPTTAMTIDPSTGNLLVVRDPTSGETLVQEVDPSDASLVANHGSGAGIATVQGVAYDASRATIALTYSATPPGNGIFLLDDDGPSIPDVTVEPPTSVSSTTATLRGTINPNGFAQYRFEYSADGVNWQPAGDLTPLAGVTTVPVSANVTGLQPNTLYRVRVVTVSTVGGAANGPVPQVTNESSELTLATDAAAPDVQTLGSANRTDTSAQLRATVDANGSATTYRFEYGPAGGSFTSRMPIPDAAAGSGNEPQLVLQNLSGLVPATAYHYRVVATNSVGTSTGSPVTFETAPSGATPPLGGRAYELVSPSDKVGGVGVGEWGGGAGGAGANSGHPAHAGDRFAATGEVGSVLLDGATAYASDWAFADRTHAGWVSHSPVTHAGSDRESYRFLQMHSASEDLSTVTWKSGGGMLRPFAEIADWPDVNAVFVGDWEGRWETLAPTDDDQLAAPGDELSIAFPAVSADGSHIAFSTSTTATATPRARPAGLAGPGDPTDPAWPDLVAGRAAYVDDVSSGLSDQFDGNGVYSNVGVCAGDTLIPEHVAGVLEDQACAPPAGLPAGPDATLISNRGAAIHAVATTGAGSAQNVKNVVSRDGARTFFMSPDPVASGVPAAGCSGTGADTLCPPQLYVRQRNGDGTVTTRWISRAQDGLFGSQAGSLTGTAIFAGASDDGDKVFFQTNSPLTADDPNGTGAPVAGGVVTGSPSSASWDLYVYDLPDGPDGDPSTPDADPAGGTLKRVSGGPTGTADCNVVSAPTDGSLRFASDDGSRAYFTCSAPLTGVDLPSNGTITVPQTGASGTNLYSYSADAASESWGFVARLPKGGEIGSCATSDSTGTKGMLVTRALSGGLLNFSPDSCVSGTADGAFVTFWTVGRLTLDDPNDTTIDGYAYDADRDSLTRITAPQGGVGGSYLCNTVTLDPIFAAGAGPPVQCNGDNGFGPGTIELLGVATKPLIDGDRVAFFQSRSRLVYEDVDNAYDVYQWRNGELSLISTGNSALDGSPKEPGGSFYKGNDETGRNVYFATNDRLTWQDADAVLDIYVSRVGGGIPQPTSPQLCGVLAGGCHGPGAGSVSVDRETSSGRSAGNAAVGSRRTVGLALPSAKARRRAARTGTLPLRVRSSHAGLVRLIARGRLGSRKRVLGKGSAQLSKPGTATVKVRLSSAAQRSLARGRRLSLTIQVRFGGARPESVAVALRRTK